MRDGMKDDTKILTGRNPSRSRARRRSVTTTGRLLLPGAFLVTMGAKLLAPFVFVDFRFATFFQ